MTKRTHIAVGVAVTLPIILNYHPVISWVGIVGSIVPDFDFLFGIEHRTITHSLIAITISTIFIYLFNANVAAIFAINYCIHLVLDSFTIMGIPLLYPFDKKYYGLKLVRTGGTEDLLICLLAIYIIFTIRL